MGRELQKRKRRSSRQKVTMPTRRKKALNPLGSTTIAKNWDKKQTLEQNYQRFGLVSKLSKSVAASTSSSSSKNPLAVQSGDQGLLTVREVKVERDPTTGKIIRVLRDTNPLNDPLNDLDSDANDSDDSGPEEASSTKKRKEYEEWGGIIDEGRREKNFGGGGEEEDKEKPEVLRELEYEASFPEKKKTRHQSERELEWLGRLVEKHGSDVMAMVRDHKLNPMQQTKGDITKRLKRAGLLDA